MERAAFAAADSFSVMRRAAAAVAEQARTMSRNGRPIVALAGPGNNGGDALLAALQLKQEGLKARAVLVGASRKLPPDAARALALWQKGGGDTSDRLADTNGDLREAVFIDGLLGIGLARPTGGRIAECIKMIRPHWRRTLAVDVPSGIDSDTGAARGEAAVAARTVTFFAMKPGLCTGEGMQAAGDIVVADLDGSHFPKPCGALLDDEKGLDIARLRRTKNSHKGTFGSAMIVGGNDGMVGALALASRAAVRMGAGKTVALCAAKQPPPLDWRAPEVMWRRASPDDSNSFTAAADSLAIGPGLADGRHASALLSAAIKAKSPLIVDADGLNLIAAKKTLAAQLAARRGETMLTPHPAEAARLLQCEVGDIQQDRIGAAKQLARQHKATAILKGAGTVVANRRGEWAICAAGNPGLAQGGSGDVLCGMIAALLAQTGDSWFSARAGVWLHAAAADSLAGGEERNEIGMDLNQLAAAAARLTNKIIAADTRALSA